MSDRNPPPQLESEGSIEHVLERAQRIRAAQADQARRDSPREAEVSLMTSLWEFAAHLSWLSSLFRTVRQVVLGLSDTIAAPVWRIAKPPLAWVWRRYYAIWSRWAYVREASSNQRVLSRTRASMIVILTVFGLSIFTQTRLGEAVRFFTIEPLVDGAMMAASLRVETFYLTQAEEIDPRDNVYSVRGCRTRGECSEADAAYFRVAPRLSHDIWKLVEYGNPLYVPDHAVAPIAPGLNECRVTYYGYRMTSSWIARILRSLQVYPTMLEASCDFVAYQNR